MAWPVQYLDIGEEALHVDTAHIEEVEMVKTLLLRAVFVLFALLSLMPWGAFAAGGGLRQAFIGQTGVRAVYIVDRTHTFILTSLPDGLAGDRDYRVLGRYDDNTGHGLVGLMMEHAVEPARYKAVALPSLGALREAPKVLSRSPFSKGERESGYSSIDIFETATISCVTRGGRPRYVIPMRYGRFKRLTEVPAIEAFTYLLLKGSGGVWFAACDGEGQAKFQVMKNYDFINGGRDVVELREGVALEGVDYVKDSALEAKRLRSLEGQWASGRSSIEDTVREIALLKTDFVKNVGGTRYYGFYGNEGPTEGCATVSLKRVSLKANARVTVVRDYRVCSGKVSVIGFSETKRHLSGAHVTYRPGGGVRFARSD